MTTPLTEERTDIYINTHLGDGDAAEEIKDWVRVTAAQRGYGSMSEFMRVLIQEERAREEYDVQRG